MSDNKTITELDSGGALQNGDITVIVRNGANFRATYNGSTFTLPAYSNYNTLPSSATANSFAVTQASYSSGSNIYAAGLYQYVSSAWLYLGTQPDNTTITITNGKLSIVNGSIGSTQLATIAAGTVLANATGSTTNPQAISIATTFKTALGLTKSDVGLGNVPNIDTTNANNITSGTLNAARLPTNIPAINIGDGSVTNTEFQYLDGVTNNIQSQLNDLVTIKAPLASPAFTGTPTAPTAALNTSNTQVATTAFVQNTFNNYTIPLLSGRILVGNSSNQAEAFTPAGDVSITNTGITIINGNVVSNSKLAQAAALTVKCNPTNATANEQDVSIVTTFKPLLQLSKTDVGLSNVPNTDATNLANDTIQGTFTPSNVAIVTADNGLTIAQKTQGQLNNKQNLVSPAVANDFVYLDSTGQVIDSGVSLSTDNTFATPTNMQVPSTLAVQGYVQSYVQGLNVKASCICATTANIILSGPQVLDGITPANGARVLVKNQINTADNGILIVNTAGVWTRSNDANIWSELVGAYVFIEQGSTQAATSWNCTVASGGTIGTTPITWSQFSGAGTYTAGTGLSLNGTVFSIANTGIVTGTYGGSLKTIAASVNAQGQWIGVTEYTLPVQSIVNGNGILVSSNSGTFTIAANYDNSTIQLNGSNQLSVNGANLTNVLHPANNLSDVSSQQLALNNLTAVSAASSNMILTKDSATGNALFQNLTLSVQLSSLANVMTIDINGNSDTADIINSNTLSKPNNNTIRSTVNGIQSAADATIVSFLQMAISGKNLTTNINNITSSAITIPATGITYTLSNILYVSSSGSSGNDGLSPYTPKDLASALTTAGNTGYQIILLPGTYTGNFSISNLNLTLSAFNYEVSGVVNFTGTITVSNASSSTRFIGISSANWAVSASGSVYMYNCTSGTAFVKSGSGYLLQSMCDTQGPSLTGAINITGSGSTILTNNCTVGFSTVNNASASVSVLNALSCAPMSLTTGLLNVAYSTVYSATPTGNAIVATGGVLYLSDCGLLTASTPPVARINVGASCTYYIKGTLYDKTNSTLSGAVLANTYYTVQYQYLNALTLSATNMTATNITANSFFGDGASITNITATNITGRITSSNVPIATTLLGNTVNSGTGLLQLVGGIAPTANLPANTTYQGNSFNGNSQLVQLNSTGQLPALDGSNLTNINLSNAGTLPVGSLPFYGQLQPCIAVSTSNLALTGILVVDGITPTTGQRILATGQTTASQNGIYAANTAGAWTRTTDMPTGAGLTTGGITIPILSGDLYAGSTWQLNTIGTITIGTTNLSFAVASRQAITSLYNKATASSPIAINTNIPEPVTTITGTTTLTYANKYVLSNATAALTITLPAPDASYAGAEFTIVLIGGGDATIQAASSSINGQATILATVLYEAYKFIMTGTEYVVSSSNLFSPLNAAGLSINNSLAIGSSPFTPLARVHIKNGRSITTGGNNRWYNVASNAGFSSPTSGADSFNGGLVVEASITATGTFGAVGSITSSDSRIKNILGKSNINECVEIIKNLEITDYDYIDKTHDFNNKQKKLIAQQVKNCYPEAVHIRTSVIPNIMQFSVVTDIANNQISINKVDFDFNLNNKIKVFIENANHKEDMEFIVNIIEINENKLILDIDTTQYQIKDAAKVFIYGEQVNDFLYIDYDAVFCANIAATQYLLNKITELEEKLGK